MNTVENEPNWMLVTENFSSPTTFSDLLYLLIPNRTEKSGYDSQVLSWKEKEFYKKETILPFIQFGMKVMKELPKFNKDEMPTILRIVRLCQEVRWYEQAYNILKEQQILPFIFNSLEIEVWDDFTKATAWNYIIVKQKALRLEECDYAIWEKIKYDLSWIPSCPHLASEKEIIECKLLFLCREARDMDTNKFEELSMELAIYCNSTISNLYTYNLVETYKRCISYLEDHTENRMIIACHYAILAQLAEFFYDPYQFIMDDYVAVMRDMMAHLNFSLYEKYKEFIGTLLSYISFYQLIRVPQQTDYFQEMLTMSRGIPYKEDLLREYVFSQVTDKTNGFLNTFYYNNCQSIIEEIIAYWCTDEQRNILQVTYHMYGTI
ncbi:DUF3965 domain-containing protein [Ectobacillus sp. sgz5001026]|uniref:DUF3965 domain-containing protein n=1 Tax=Ectobacillus sp. sgz5001026 TaxID=3242473 RepID=UPI0036D263DC